ncbi:MAG: hypothetical protein KJ914_01220 [Gammaproteobacteria bacterium]|nr:hypothetical protein [Gammaproteobacteria bacterium]MBU1722923.1 hypothetical protein [Gammaproteobacteria bacterium]MBU2005700.1 hypothetical protein [Gammaproteobacteria bacterium]
MPPEVTGIDTLLKQLRLRGIPVSTLEMQRLSAVFQREPHITRAELRELLCALLGKEENQRRTIRRLFEQLVPFAEAAVLPETSGSTLAFNASQPRQALETELATPRPTVKHPFDYWQVGWKLMLLITLLAFVFWYWYPVDKQTDVSSDSQITAADQTSSPLAVHSLLEDKNTSELQLVDSIETWKVEVKVIPQNLWKDLLPNLILFVGAGLGFFWLLNKAIQRTWIRTPEPPVLRAQPGRFHLPNLKNLADYHLLSGSERREMSWGINRYLTDSPFNKLDIPASVEASARSGLPAIEYLHASREREVWLWQDQDSGNADLLKLAEEIGDTLRAAKIEVQRGYFRGLPDMIRSERGEVIWSSKHEYPEHQPLVVVLVDGNSLAQLGVLQKPETHIAFRQLGHWATLCMVDCSQQPGNLCSVTKPYDLDCLQPHEVAGWLARQGEPQQAQATACVIDSLHLWAVACSLPERVLMEDEIRALHDALGLNCAWQYHALRRYAESAGLGLDFSRSRLALLQEFARLAEQDTKRVNTVIGYWLQRTNEIDATLCAEETEHRPWKNTLKQQRLYLERALLKLWTPLDTGELEEISSTAQTLYDLHALPKLKAEVERKLGQYACQNWQETTGITPANPGEWICLPLRWESLPPQTQHQLKAAGFGGKAEKLPLRWDKMTSILLGALLGVMCIAVGHGIWQWMPKPAIIRTTSNSAKPPLNAIIKYPPKITIDTHDLWVGTAKQNIEKEKLHPNSTVQVKWSRQIQVARNIISNTDELKENEYNQTELWLAGKRANPDRPKEKDWPLVSIAIIEGSTTDHEIRKLAAALLDTGTADQVVVGKNWHKAIDNLQKEWSSIPSTQWIYINAQHTHKKSDTTSAQLNIEPHILYNMLRSERLYQAKDLAQYGKTDKDIKIQGRYPIKINTDVFLEEVKNSLFNGKLEQSQIDGLNLFIKEWKKQGHDDFRWLAYMLATAYHESSIPSPYQESPIPYKDDEVMHTMQPTREPGLGVGKSYGEKYYGRGFVQLSWEQHYEKIGKEIGVDLIKNPDMALDSQIAVEIIFKGMIDGVFTGKSLKDYFNENSDWYNARRILNGLERAAKIAEYAKNFNAALEKSIEREINRNIFFDIIKSNPFSNELNNSQVEGMNIILDEWDKRNLTDVRWLAYILATTYHETGRTMQPISETGHGQGKKYGIPDKDTGLIYYGRGLVQLTWKENYEGIGSIIGEDLVKQPDKALEPQIATKILFELMIRGTINSDPSGSPYNLERYFNKENSDWYGARRIGNAQLDRATQIADYARAFYFALEQSYKIKEL